MTSSAAAAISSTIATSVTCSSRPRASVVPLRSTTGRRPAQPMATSVTPRRQGRPKVSLTTTATSTPNRWRRASRIRRAERSESTGSSAARPASTLERSMPALAHTKPCSVSLMIRSPRRRRIRTDSRSTSGLWPTSGSMSTSRSSALETTFWVTTTTSPSTRSAASAMRPARSSPTRTSGRPSTGMTWIAGNAGCPVVIGEPLHSWKRLQPA